MISFVIVGLESLVAVSEGVAGLLVYPLGAASSPVAGWGEPPAVAELTVYVLVLAFIQSVVGQGLGAPVAGGALLVVATTVGADLFSLEHSATAPGKWKN